MAANTTVYDIIARDKASSVMDGIGASSGGLNKKLGTLGKGAADALGGELNQAESRMSRFTSGMGKGLAAGGIAAGTALGGAVVMGFTKSLDIEAAQAKFRVQLGGDAEFSAEMGKVAGDLYASAYGESLGQVNEAVRSVVTSGALMEDASTEQIQSITGQAMSLATAFDQDVGGTMRAVAQMIRTGLAPDAQSALDIITRGFQQGNDKAGDLLDTVNEYSGQFQKLGIDGAAAMGLITQGLQAGARDADKVADAVKEFSIRAIDGSLAASNAYKALGLDAQAMTAQIARGGPEAAAGLQTVLDRLRGMTDPVERSAAAVGLFGTQAEDLGAALFALDPSRAAGALGDIAGAAQEADQIMGDLAQNKILALQRGFEAWTVSLVATDGPLGDVTASAMAFGEPALSMAGSLGMVAVGMQALGVTSLISAGALGTFWAALTGPVGIAVAVIIGAVALIWYHWDTLKEVPGKVIGFFAGFPGMLADTATNAWNSFTGGLSSAWDATVAWVSNAPYNIGYLLGSLIGICASVAIAGWNGFTGGLVTAWNWTVEFVTSAPGKIGGFLSRLPGVLWDAGWRGLIGLKDGAVGAFRWTVDFVVGIPGNILRGLGNLGNLLVGAGRAVIDGLLRGIKDKYNDMLNFVKGIAAGIAAHKGPLDYDRTLLIPAGNAIMGGLLAGLRQGNSPVQNYVGGIADGIASHLNRPFGAGLGAAVLSPGFGVPGGYGQANQLPPIIRLPMPREPIEQLMMEVIRKALRAAGLDPTVLGG